MNDSILDVSALATPTIAIVSLVKVSFPRAQSWVYILSAFATGISIALLIGIASDTLITNAGIAQHVLEGMNAALVAAGVHHLDKHATSRRTQAKRVRDGNAAEGPPHGPQTQTTAGKRKTV